MTIKSFVKMVELVLMNHRQVDLVVHVPQNTLALHVAISLMTVIHQNVRMVIALMEFGHIRIKNHSRVTVTLDLNYLLTGLLAKIRIFTDELFYTVQV